MLPTLPLLVERFSLGSRDSISSVCISVTPLNWALQKQIMVHAIDFSFLCKGDMTLTGKHSFKDLPPPTLLRGWALLQPIAAPLPTFRRVCFSRRGRGGGGGGGGKVRAPIIKAIFQGEVARPRSASSFLLLHSLGMSLKIQNSISTWDKIRQKLMASSICLLTSIPRHCGFILRRAYRVTEQIDDLVCCAFCFAPLSPIAVE